MGKSLQTEIFLLEWNENEKKKMEDDIFGAGCFLPRSILRCQIPIRAAVAASAQIFEIVVADPSSFGQHF